MSSSSVVLTVITFPGQIVACLRVVVTVTLAAVREAVVTGPAFLADTPVDERHTQTLARLYITEVVPRSDSMAVAGCK